MCFCFFAIIYRWKWAGPIILTNLNSFHPRMLLKCGKNWSSCSLGEDFKFCYFVIILPWKKVGYFILKFESPSAKDVLCQVCLKMAQWFWRRRLKCWINFAVSKAFLASNFVEISEQN